MQIESYIYVCQKNGIDYRKPLSKELHYRKLRYNLFRILRKKEKAADCLEMCAFLKEKLKGAIDA